MSHSYLRVSAAAVVFALLALLSSPPPARACSCAMFDVGEAVAEGAVGIVGEVLDVGEAQGDAFANVPHLVRVDAATEPMARDVVVHAPSGGSAGCGVDAAAGFRVGWLLGEEDGRLTTSLCSAPGEAALAPFVQPVDGYGGATGSGRDFPARPASRATTAMAAGGGLLLLVGAVALVVVFTRGREERTDE